MAKSVLGKNPLERTKNGGSAPAGNSTKKSSGTKAAAKKKSGSAKKTTAKKATAKKPDAKKPAPKKTAEKKPVAKKVAAKKPAVKKTATKTAVKKPAAKKTATKSTVKKTVAKNVTPKAAASATVAAKPVSVAKPAAPKTEKKQSAKEAAAKSAAVSWRRKIGDGYGYEPEYESKVKGILDTLYSNYWRAEVEGIENIPASGKVLLVANHAGMLPYDSLMIREAVSRNHPEKRLVRPLLEDFIYYFPFLGTFMARLGSVRACQENGQSLLNRGDVALVFPEGIKGIEKQYKKRYRLQRFGRGGFIRLAMNTRAPIVPVAVIGSEETHPVLANFEQVAKLLGLPYLPLTPTFPLLGPLGLLPLPSKWKIVFGKPIPFDEYTADQVHDRILVNKLVERVRSRLQSMIDKELAARKSPWRG